MLQKQPSDIPPVTPEFVTRAQLAERYRLGVSTLAKLFLNGGGPPAIRIGRSVRYHVPTADKWMLERQQRTTSDVTRD